MNTLNPSVMSSCPTSRVVDSVSTLAAQSHQQALYALHQEFGQRLTTLLLRRYPNLLPRLANTLEQRVTWKPYHRRNLYLVHSLAEPS